MTNQQKGRYHVAKKTPLPAERRALTHRVQIGTTKLYIITGEYEDGRLAEIFLTVDKEGGGLRVYDLLAIMISMALQRGVSLSEIVQKLKGQQMEPSGVTNNPKIPIAKSISDYVARWLEMKYPEGTRIE